MITTERGFNHVLVVVYVYDGKTDAEPMKGKEADPALAALKCIKFYERGTLNPLELMMQCDPGKEFQGAFANYFKSVLKATLRVGKKGRHKMQVYAENQN